MQFFFFFGTVTKKKLEKKCSSQGKESVLLLTLQTHLWEFKVNNTIQTSSLQLNDVCRMFYNDYSKSKQFKTCFAVLTWIIFSVWFNDLKISETKILGSHFRHILGLSGRWRGEAAAAIRQWGDSETLWSNNRGQCWVTLNTQPCVHPSLSPSLSGHSPV